MKKLILLAIIPISTSYFSLFAQDSLALQWSQVEENLGNANIYGPFLNLDSHNNIYVSGRAEFPGVDGGLKVVQYDSLGNFNWEYTFNEFAFLAEYPLGHILDSEDNSLILIRRFTGYFGTSALLKVSPEGEELWKYEYHENEPNNAGGLFLDTDEEDNVYTIGTRIDQDTNEKRHFIIKFSPSGEVIWKKEHPADVSFLLTSIHAEVSQGQVIIYYSSQNQYIIKFDQETGDFLSSSPVEVALDSGPIVKDEVGNYLKGDENGEYEIAKFDHEGHFLWEYVIPVEPVDPPSGVLTRMENLAIDTTNNIYASGYFYTDTVGWNLVTLKLNPEGELIWRNDYAGNGQFQPIPFDLDVSSDLVVVTGLVGNQGVDWDRLILLYDLDGNFIQEIRFSTPGLLFETGEDVVASGKSVYLTGISMETGLATDTSNVLTQRYDLVPIINSTQEAQLPRIDISISPNPFTELLHLHDPQGLVARYQLYDGLGKLWQAGAVNASDPILIREELPTAIYWLELLDIQGKLIGVEQVVKQ